MTAAYPSPSNPTENMSTTATTAATQAAQGTTPTDHGEHHALLPQQVEILEARGLNVELAVGLGWRSSRNANAGNGWMIEIPFYAGFDKHGEPIEVNCKTRTLSGEKRFYQKSGARKVFYNQNAIADWQVAVQAGTEGGSSELLICEGEIDCLTAMQCGYLAVSVPDGAPAKRVVDDESPEDHESAKYSFLDGFPKTGTVIICADGDEAGANLLHDLAGLLGKHRCKWVRYPKGCKDLNEVICAYGIKGIEATMKRAEWFPIDGVYRMSQLPPEPTQDVMPCGILPHNLRTGEVSIWTGIPGFGKTTLLNAVTFQIAEEQKRQVAYASFEQPPQGEHKDNLRALYLGRPPEEASEHDLRDADDWIDRNFSFIVPDIDKDEDADLTWLFDKMATAAARYGVKMFVVDPWNELDHAYDRREMNQTDYTGFAIKQFIRFARRMRIHVAIVAHPAKLKKDKYGHYPIPGLYDIADSAHWYNKPHLGVIVHRKHGLTMVRVEKSKYQDERKIGPTGDFWLEFDLRTKRFSPTQAPVRPSTPRRKKKDDEAAKAIADDDKPDERDI